MVFLLDPLEDRHGEGAGMPAVPPPEGGRGGDGQGRSWALVVVLVCPEKTGGLECLEGVSAYWGAVNPQLWGLLFWEMAALGEADRVFIERLHCSRHWGRGAKDKQGLFGGQLLCLGVPGCVLQASLCGCD